MMPPIAGKAFRQWRFEEDKPTPNSEEAQTLDMKDRSPASSTDDDDEGGGGGEVLSDDDSSTTGGGVEEDDGEEDRGDAKDADFAPDDEDSDSSRKSQNVAALVRGNLVVKRQPLLPRVLSVSEGAAVARKPFKPPSSNGYQDQNELLIRRLWARKKFVPWGSTSPVLVAVHTPFKEAVSCETEKLNDNEPLPPEIEPLVLWQPEESGEGSRSTVIEVESLLVRFLRPHQREGVQFMFDCVSGLSSGTGISGCILADDMGLGKTLQSITVLYTLLRQGFDGNPMVKRALIVTPTSLVSNWESEINKWVGGGLKIIALCESTRADVVSGIDSFLRPLSPFQVLIISYETFRMHSSKFEKNGSCDLLICDEAHRLKNDQTLTNRALASLPCSRRILLSGTPMQNDLEEFYAMVNFTNPGVLGDAAYFRRHYETPIICGREPTATAEERKLGADRSAELSAKVNQFILRRTNALLSNHLPPKIVEVVCCKLTPLQAQLYSHFLQSKNVKQVMIEEMKQSTILAYITALKKLCNHPKLIYDTVKSGGTGKSGFEDCLRFFPAELFSGRSGTWTGGDGIWVELSGKMHVLARLLAHLRHKTDDRIVLVSNYTQTLDLFAQLCRERRYPFLRLDGGTSIGKRQKLVTRFNDFSKDEFAFLLSSKAGGCGLNLIGGNRLVLFDPDWNPANDKQAAARVWRDGQKKRVYIYRFLSAGTIEEKVFQRQMSKEGLQKVIQQEQMDNLLQQENFFSMEDLRDLFTFNEDVRSEIHENLNCRRCKSLTSDPKYHPKDSKTFELHSNATESGNRMSNGSTDLDIGGFAEISGCLDKLQSSERQLGTPLEEDLGSWGHHFSTKTVPDLILQASAGEEVTFVFTNQVDGKLVPVESTDKSKATERETEKKIHHPRLMSSSPKLSPMQSPLLSAAATLSGKENPMKRSSPGFSKTVQEISNKTARSSLEGLRKPFSSIQNVIPFERTQKNHTDDDDFL